MRIAFVVGHFPLLSETFILNQATGLIDRGHEVDIYTESWGDTDHVHPDVTRYGLLDRTIWFPNPPGDLIARTTKGIQLFFNQFWQAPEQFLRALNLFKHGTIVGGWWLTYAAAALLERGPYEIVHAQFGTQGFRALLLQKVLRPRPKLVVTFRGHDISTHVKKHGDRVYNQLFARADLLMANCEFFRQRAIALGCDAKRIIVHRSGLDCHKFPFQTRCAPTNGPIRIVTTGRLVEKKGIEYAIRAVAQVARLYPNLEYLIIGDGILKAHFEQLIDTLDARRFIHLLGWKNETEILELLTHCHIFIAPSVTAADGNQDAPINVLKEAMATGVPVISTRHGGIPELVEDGVSGFLVPERDAEAIAQKLSYLLDHPECWAEMGKAGRNYVEAHYDLDKLNDRLVEVYKMLLTDEF